MADAALTSGPGYVMIFFTEANIQAPQPWVSEAAPPSQKPENSDRFHVG
jgi:hypothetical protein